MILNKGLYGQYVSGTGYNYGLIANNGGDGQFALEIGYNYGLIANNGGKGQEIRGKGYNYGLIANTGNGGQYIDNYNDKNAIGYNYGVIANDGESGQYIGVGAGVTYKGGTGYNYGVIANTGSYGQQIAGGGTGYNYGIIANTGSTNIYIKGTGTAYNYGVVKNTTGAVFSGNVDNYGIVIYTTDNQSGGLGEGINKGVVLDSTYTLVSGKNNQVTDLSSTGSISGDNDKTYYTKDNTIDFSQDLTGNVLTAVITDTTGNKVAYNYTTDELYNGSDELVLNDSVVTGYFTDGGKGTLLNISDGKDLVLVDTTINAVTDIDNRNNVTAVNLNGGSLTQIGESQIVGKVEGEGVVNYVASQSKEQAVGIDGELILRNATNEEATQYNITDNITDISFKTLEADKLVLNFVENTEGKEANEIVLGDNVVIGKSPTETLTTTNSVIDGSSSTEKIDLTINDITGIYGDITLGSNDDTLTIAKNYAYDGVIDLGNGTNDILNLSHSDEGTTHVKNEENTFNYKVHNVEEINLTGGHWHIDNTKTEITGDKVNLNISGELHVEVNSLGAGKGVETSMDGVGKDVNDFTVSAGEGIKFVVGDNFNALEPS